MPINISHAELKETQTQGLPPASLETLKTMRDEACTTSKSSDFKLQTQQRFLRRVLSPDSPVRNVLMFHGTGSGKTCSSIQVAEEYIIRPEFQDKKVIVLANPAVQSNFISSIFEMSRVVVDNEGLLASKQCTGRRYLDMLQRIQTEPMRWTDPSVRDRLNSVVQKIIGEFYEFKGYSAFANDLETQKLAGGVNKWIHDTFDNRLIIVDEAHALRDISDGKSGKIRSSAMEQIIQTADNVTLILLTATPMFDNYEEIMYYFNLFLWNDRKISVREKLSVSKYFLKNGDFVSPNAEKEFRGWCQDYVSFVRGDNPLTFPFRLPPPDALVANPDKARDSRNRFIPAEERRKYLTLTQSFVQGEQAAMLKGESGEIQSGVVDDSIICVFPGGQRASATFDSISGEEASYKYKDGIPPFLAPSTVANYSSKFALIMKIIQESVGIIFVYSNSVQYGAQPFSMCLEEHGYEPAFGNRILKDTSNEVPRGSKGKYVLLSEISDSDLKKALQRLKRPENVGGEDIRIIVASPRIAEGVDLRFVRQVHVLDPWFNMSRLEQVVGRGIRTCSHQLLPFEHQNCTIYYHICRFPDSNKETRDETIYRLYVEIKAVAIAKVKKVIMESAMDCPLQEESNRLPPDWRGLLIPQVRSQNGEPVQLSLEQMSSPIFGVNLEDMTCKVITLPPDPEHSRPLSAVLDVRDEILDKLVKLFARKSVWSKADMFKSSELRMYDQDVLIYVLQDAVESGFRIKDRNDRVGHIESRENMYAFAIGPHDSLQERIVPVDKGRIVQLPDRKVLPSVQEKPPMEDLSEIRGSYKWTGDAVTRFSSEVLDWYIVDHVLTDDQRMKHMIGLDWSNPPLYAAPLKAGSMYMFGPTMILDSEFQVTTPIGDQADIAKQWLEQRKQAYLDTRDSMFATMKNHTILFNLDEKADTLKKAQRSNNIGGRACLNYQQSLLNLFAVWLGGTPFPNTVKTKIDQCQYISLLVRDAILKRKEGIIWWTPEEWLFFNEDSTSKDLRSRLKM